VSITHGGVASGGTTTLSTPSTSNRLFPHLCLTLYGVFLKVEEELPGGEDEEVEESSGV
jgi:hypothetical protein